MATTTPWGKSQYSRKYGAGIIFYGTAGHGGFHVSAGKLAKMPEHLRNEGGWYEEDCEWCKVAIAFPALFDQNSLTQAKDTFKNWFPDTYEKHYGVKLVKGESHVRDEQVFLEEHKNDYLVLAACGRKDGTVEVLAGRGGRLPNGMYPTDTKWFSVPDAEYHPKMVLDETKHKVLYEKQG